MIHVTNSTGGMAYVSAWLGPVSYPVNFEILVNTLTTKEVGIDGRLKPNVLFSEDGKLIASIVSTAAAAVAASGNTGNGTVGALVGKAGKLSEVITLKAISATVFAVVGSRSGRLANATVGSPYTSNTLNFTITAGGTAFVAGDEFQIVVTGADATPVYGGTIEAEQIVAANPTDASLAASNAKVQVGVCVIGVLNRNIARDVLGRDYTTAEIAATKAPGSTVKLTPANAA